MKIIVDEMPKYAGDCLFSTNSSVLEYRGCSLPGAYNAICVLEFNGFCPYLTTLPQSTATTKQLDFITSLAQTIPTEISG